MYKPIHTTICTACKSKTDDPSTFSSLMPYTSHTRLKSILEKTYNEAKMELPVKYQNHYFPDNILKAQATNKTKKFM